MDEVKLWVLGWLFAPFVTLAVLAALRFIFERLFPSAFASESLEVNLMACTGELTRRRPSAPSLAKPAR